MVLNDFGPLGRDYIETDEAETDGAAIVENILSGAYSHPVRMVAFNTVEGWSRDVTEDVARALLKKAQSEHRRAGVFRQFADRVEKGNPSHPTPRQGPSHSRTLTYAASHRR